MKKRPAHNVPKDLREAIKGTEKAEKTWGQVNPLAKNEWACWVMSAKKEGARIMFTINDPEKRWVNGTLGTVVEIKK